MKSILKIIVISVVLVSLAGCASIPYKPPPITPSVSGIYHEVQKGDTVWGVSKAYGADMKEIIRLNRLPDASKINVGQLIFIPYAEKRVDTSKSYVRGETFIWPVRGKVISFFGSMKEGVKNKGIDILAKKGQKVFASRSGKVSFCDERVKGFGKTIIIDHGGGYSSVYAHNSDILVKVGDPIRQGSIIARAGQTGRAKVSSLHFEIRKEHKPENPFYYLP